MRYEDPFPYVVYDTFNNPQSWHVSPKAALRGCRRGFSISFRDDAAVKELEAVEPEFEARKAERLARLRGQKPNAA